MKSSRFGSGNEPVGPAWPVSWLLLTRGSGPRIRLADPTLETLPGLFYSKAFVLPILNNTPFVSYSSIKPPQNPYTWYVRMRVSNHTHYQADSQGDPINSYNICTRTTNCCRHLEGALGFGLPVIFPLSFFPRFFVLLWCLQAAAAVVFCSFCSFLFQLVLFRVLATSPAGGGHDRLFLPVFAFIFLLFLFQFVLFVFVSSLIVSFRFSIS